MRFGYSLFVLWVVALLSGCATSYQPQSFTGGYSETQLAPDMFRIYFRGNSSTSMERAQDFALLRAAELAKQRDFSCFAVINERSSTATSTFTTPGRSYSSGSAFASGNSATYSGSTIYYPGQTQTLYMPRTGLLIKCFVAKPDNVYTFDCAFLAQSLKQKYGIK